MAVKNLLVAKLTFLFVQAMLFFPFVIWPITSGLDSAWQYELNFLPDTDYRFGRDILFTYGPLGYLFVPQAVADNVFWSWLTVGALYALMIGATVWVLFSPRLAHINRRVANIWAAAVLLFAAELAGLYTIEYWTSYIILLLLAASLHERNPKWFFYAALAVALLTTVLKFSMTAMAAVTLVSFAAIINCKKTANRKQLSLAILFGLPLIFSLCFLAYNPDLPDLINYVQGALKISSGYAYNMSADTPHVEYMELMPWFGCLFAVAVVLIRRRCPADRYLMGLFALPLFIVYRHAIVRADHILIVGYVFLAFASVFVLFMESDLPLPSFCRTWRGGVLSVLLLILAVMPLYRATPRENTLPIYAYVQGASVYPWELYAARFKYMANLPRLYAERHSWGDQRTKCFPAKWRKIFQNSTVSFYPWEIYYYSLDDDYKFVPLPVFPINAATPWLDRYNAKFMASDAAPRYIVLSLDTVDDQYPLLANPLLWREIFTRYQCLDFDGHHFLLQRRKQSRLEVRAETKQVIRQDETVNLPRLEPDEHLILKIDAANNFYGTWAKLFYKIPAIFMQVELDDGRQYERRIILPVWENGVMIDLLPIDNEEFLSLINTGQGHRVKNLRFKGEGLNFYQADFDITLTTISAKQ